MEYVWLVEVWAVLGYELVEGCGRVFFTALHFNGDDVFLSPKFRVCNQEINLHVKLCVVAVTGGEEVKFPSRGRQHLRDNVLHKHPFI